MSYSLQVWIGQVLRDVDEDGSHCAQIVLRGVENGTPWQTWRITRETDPNALLAEIGVVMEGLGESFAVGKNQVIFVAMDQHMADFSRFPTFIFGKNRDKRASDLTTQTEAHQAIAGTMTAFAETFKSLLAPIQGQMGFMMKHIEALQQSVIAQTTYICSLQEEKALAAAQAREESSGTKELIDGAKQYLPTIVEMIGAAIAKGSNSPAAAAAAQVAAQSAAAVKSGAPPIHLQQ